MMSSSPKPASVQAFEYQEPGGFHATLEEVTPDTRQAPQAPVRETPDQMELKLAAARAEGTQEGLQQAQQSLEQVLAGERAKVAEAIRDFAQKTRDYYSRVEAEMVHLSLAIATKILHREATVDRMLVAALVKVALEKLQHGTTASVRVRPEEVADWNRYFEGNTNGEIRVEVKPDSSVAAHNCILETELGTTELGLDVQLKEIEQGFFDLLAQRPDNR
jgi:flagellar assembly protein FliH